MTQGWTQKECEKLYRHYTDETGQQEFEPSAVAAWAKKRGYSMPVPPTDVEMLSALLRRAGGRAKRKDPKTSIVYRGMLAFTAIVKGERKIHWFDSDGLAATPDKITQSSLTRREQALNILAAIASTRERWKRTHPTKQLEEIDLSISEEEVNWRVLGRTQNNDDQSLKVG